MKSKKTTILTLSLYLYLKYLFVRVRCGLRSKISYSLDKKLSKGVGTHDFPAFPLKMKESAIHFFSEKSHLASREMVSKIISSFT